MRVTSVEINPTPLAAAHEDPGVALQVQVALVNAADDVLVTVALATSPGPALLTTMVHTSVAPASTVVVLGVIATARSAAMGVSTTDMASLAGLGSLGTLPCRIAIFVTMSG